jgi:uroporphyrinogen III methyltransferase / synthase
MMAPDASRAAGGAPHPLAGRHIVITRPPEQAPELASALEAIGARVTTLSAIAIAPVEDTTALDAAARALGTFDWVVLTSANGVAALASRLVALGIGWGDRGRAHFAVIGPATARALELQGITPDFVPTEYVAEAIAAGLGAVAGRRILLLRADIARRALADELRRGGAEVTEVVAYCTLNQPPDVATLRGVFGADRPDVVTFTSSSTVRGLVRGLEAAGYAPERILAGVALAAIGPITAGTLREHGLEPKIVAEEYSVPGLVRAILAHFAPAAATC